MHADIQAVYCDRRWQAGLKSKATSLFDVGCWMFDVRRSSFNMFNVRCSMFDVQKNLVYPVILSGFFQRSHLLFTQVEFDFDPAIRYPTFLNAVGFNLRHRSHSKRLDFIWANPSGHKITFYNIRPKLGKFFVI